jgi:regulatory protein
MVHIITALKAQKRNPNRINVYLDGEFGFGVSRIVAAWLSVGQALSDERISALKKDDETEFAYQQALRFIDYRMRSSIEVEQYLSEKGTSPEAISQVFERLNRSGLVNDSRFARLWTDNRSEFRPRSRRSISRELRLKGIPEEVIEKTISEMLPEEDLAYQAGLKYTRKLRDSDRYTFFRKLGGFLARRGFSYDVIKPVAARLWDERENINSNNPDVASEKDEEVR